MKRPLAWICLAILLGLYLSALLAPFLAPYPPRQQFRDFPLEPPSLGQPGVAIDWLVKGEPYVLLGLQFETRLFGSKNRSRPFFLLGSDVLGRDLFSRILHGGRFSLTIGLVAVAGSSLIGVALGALAGYFGGWLDSVVMRLTDLFLSIPGLFLILGLRAIFPLDVTGPNSYWLMAAIFTLIAWSTVCRVVRGQVLTLKQREYVLAARVAGASGWWIVTRHILPFTLNYLVVQSTVLIPAFILGEVTLSYLGVGVQEPDVSWGTLLIAANSVRVLTGQSWLLWPAAFIISTTLAFNLLGDELKASRTQATRWW